MKKYELFSTMSGKLKGLVGINTNPLTNEFCQKMAKDPTIICSICYSQKMLKGVRMNCVPKFDRVGDLMSKGLIPFESIPVIKEKLGRFSAHGELINMNHLMNCIQVAKANPHTTWGLWTKRMDFIKVLGKMMVTVPDNIVLIYSNPKINTVIPVPDGFDKVFSVYTKEYVKANDIKINCGAKNCLKCKCCYSKVTTNVINELIKTDQKRKKK